MASATITWTPGGGANSISQDCEYKNINDMDWTVHSNVGPAVATATISGLGDNIVYQFRVTNNCSVGGSSVSLLDEAVSFFCALVDTEVTTDSVEYIFDNVGENVNYLVELLDDGGAVINNSTMSTISPIVSSNFTDLEPSTDYSLRVTLSLTGELDTYTHVCSPYSFTTEDLPCNAPTSVSAVIDMD